MGLLDKIYQGLFNVARFWRYVLLQFIKDNCLESASALTYTTLITLVPLMTVSLYVVNTLPGFHEFWVEMQQYIFSHFVPATGKEVQNYLNQFVEHTTQLTVIGLIFIVISAMVLIYTIEHTFNRIWSIYSRRSLVNSVMLYWSILTLTPILMGASFILNSYIWALPEVSGVSGNINLGIEKFLIYTPFLITWLCFSLIYKIIPNCMVPYRHALFGAFWSALFFEIAKILFASYVAGINLNILIYGTFATIPLFLFWLYISWCIILFGAQIVSAIGFYQFIAPSSSEWRFIQAYKWLGILWQAQQKGQSYTAYELFKQEGHLTAVEPFAQLEILENKSWIKRTSKDEYVLARDLSKYTLFDLYQDMPWRLPRVKILDPIENKDKFTKQLVLTLTEFEDLFNKSKLCNINLFSLQQEYNEFL